jgi:hypothetical protein
MQASRTRLSALIIRLSLFIVLAIFASSFIQPELKLAAPSDGKELSGNTPTLAWTDFPCDYYEVWMDERQIDSVQSGLNACVPFPLSFGKHTWYVVAVNTEQKIKLTSNKASFVINDRALEQLPPDALLLRDNWKMQSSLLVKENGAVISGSSADIHNWYTTSLPATVLTALVRNGIYPNPYVGMNNMRIPDSNDDYNKKYDLLKYIHLKDRNPWKDPYWFRTSFEVPSTYRGKNIWLTFSEINYRAEVWVNGKKIADTVEMAGMERKFRLNVTSAVNFKGTNFVAVAIYPVDNPGLPAVEPLTPLGVPGDNMGDGMISKSYTKWDAIGWDWQPAIRDREMGITEDVYLSATGSVEFDNLYVTSDLLLPDTTKAFLTITGDLMNLSEKVQNGTIRAVITGENEQITIEQPYHIEAGKSYSFFWDAKNNARLQITNPRLWWPVGYGNPNLYKIEISAVGSKGEKAVITSNFGIRKIETLIGKKERIIKINGKEVYCRGGNWVIDMMLNWNAKRYEDEILLTRNANLNILRVWGPTGAPPNAFYDAADKYGVMIWQDFLNDFWGTYRNKPGYAAPESIYEKATIAIVKRYRNHPSLVMWCGGNEGVNPRENMIVDKILATYDNRDSRFYLKRSDGDGLHGGGPYHTLNPKDYFGHNKLNGFSSEIGPSGVPVLESIEKFMPQAGNEWMEGRFPIDKTWAYHDANDWAGNDSRKFSSYDNLISRQYGRPSATDYGALTDYLNKTQLLNYDVYRSSIESINRQLWSNSSGILLWKSNSSWPSMVWQLYDWYLQAHAGYYAAKSAGEPVHIQFNRDSMDIVILNTLYKPVTDAHISAILYNASLETIWHQDRQITLSTNGVTRTGWKVPVGEELQFLKLTVKDQSDRSLSENLYWINQSYDYKALENLPQATISASVTKNENNGITKYIIHLTNKGNCIAFMIACRLQGAETNMELLPVLWNRNYITLLPKESIQLEATINNLDLTETAVVSCKAYNMKKGIIVK